MAQEMEHASPTDKPAHPNGAKDSNNAVLDPIKHAQSDSCGPTSNITTEEQQQQQQQQQNQLAIKTSDTHPIHISPILSDDLLADVGRRIRSTAESQLLGLGSLNANANDSCAQQSTSLTEHYFDNHSLQQMQGSRLIRLRNMLDLTSVTATDPSADYLSQSQLAEQNTLTLTTGTTHASNRNTAALDTIGNLLLSSCPGKKVRLNGPVRGRGAICRDLGLDLTRIRSIGVGAVVCCLNDEELSYLGAPWDEYERQADRLGLDIYRLPMAEGFAPTNVQEMDAAMTSIVQDCTLRGINVLVHCRGGVGRAGLIACSWLLKMGFVGDKSRTGSRVGDSLVGTHASSKQIVERTTSRRSNDALIDASKSDHHDKDGDDLYTTTNGSSNAHTAMAEHQIETQMDESEQEAECDTILDTVRCLVDTIRRRRSPKAIETAEQVRFLVEYVTYLHRQERLKVRFAAQNAL